MLIYVNENDHYENYTSNRNRNGNDTGKQINDPIEESLHINEPFNND